MSEPKPRKRLQQVAEAIAEHLQAHGWNGCERDEDGTPYRGVGLMADGSLVWDADSYREGFAAWAVITPEHLPEDWAWVLIAEAGMPMA